MNACEALLLGFYFSVALVVMLEIWTTEPFDFSLFESMMHGVLWVVFFGMLLGKQVVAIRRQIRQVQKERQS